MSGNDREPAPARRRIWCEVLPYAELRAKRSLDLLCRFALDPLVAVRPSDLADLPQTVRALHDAGVRVALWPMLDDADGRWANACNAQPFADYVGRVVAACDAARVPLAEIVFDVEPAIAEAEELLASARGPRLPMRIARMALRHARAFDRGSAVLAGALAELRARGVAVSSALVPPVLFDGTTARSMRPWQRALGTPADLPWDHASVMAYTSMIEGWSYGLVSRARAQWLLGATCRAARARFGDRAGVSLGAVGTGAFAREPVYRAPRELAEDVAIARAAGIEALTLFEFAGVLARPPAEAWLDAFVAPFG